MITLDNDKLTFRFPDIHFSCRASLRLVRSLRVPDDGKIYYLPEGLGYLPLRHLIDYKERLPEHVHRRGGVITSMYSSEAFWLQFVGFQYPIALKIAMGKRCAITGEAWDETLRDDPQNYIVMNDQQLLDGFCTELGVVRQFVSVSVGEDLTVEKQITGTEEVGGIQLLAVPMSVDRYRELQRNNTLEIIRDGLVQRELQKGEILFSKGSLFERGVAAGGKIRQGISKDLYGVDAWNSIQKSRCFITVVDANDWQDITSESHPLSQLRRSDYRKHKVPWFMYYSGKPPLNATNILSRLHGLSELLYQRGSSLFSEPVDTTSAVKRIDDPQSRLIQED